MEPMKLYEQWLRDFADDEETVKDLLSIKDDPKEIEDRFYRDLEFGTAGMRGVLGAGTNRLNKYNVRRVSRALAKYILTTPDGAQKGVAIAFDSRIKSDVFAKVAAGVFAANGVRVHIWPALLPVRAVPPAAEPERPPQVPREESPPVRGRGLEPSAAAAPAADVPGRGRGRTLRRPARASPSRPRRRRARARRASARPRWRRWRCARRG